MLKNIDMMVQAVKVSKSALEVREITTEFNVYLDDKNKTIKIHIDVCATYISLDDKRISKKNINKLLKEG